MDMILDKAICLGALLLFIDLIIIIADKVNNISLFEDYYVLLAVLGVALIIDPILLKFIL